MVRSDNLCFARSLAQQRTSLQHPFYARIDQRTGPQETGTAIVRAGLKDSRLAIVQCHRLRSDQTMLHNVVVGSSWNCHCSRLGVRIVHDGAACAIAKVHVTQK